MQKKTLKSSQHRLHLWWASTQAGFRRHFDSRCKMDTSSALKDRRDHFRNVLGRPGARVSRQGVQTDLHLVGTLGGPMPFPPKLPSLSASASVDPKGQEQGCSQPAATQAWSSPPSPPPPPLSPSDVSKLALCTPSPARRSGGQVTCSLAKICYHIQHLAFHGEPPGLRCANVQKCDEAS